MPEPFDVIPRLLNAQGKAYPRGAGIPKTHAKPRNFSGLEMFLASGDQQERMTAGTKLVTYLDYEISSTGFGPKRPAADHRTGGGGEIVPMETALTEYEWASLYTWHEKELQPDDVFSSADGLQRFWRIMEKREKDWTLDALLKLEREFFAAPSEAMFNGEVRNIKSLWSYINLWETRHGVTANNLFPGMTDQQGLNPADERFKRKDSVGKEKGWSLLEPTKVGYSEAGNNRTDVADHLLDQMIYLMRLMKFDPVPLAGEFGDGSDPSPRYGLASLEAMRLFDRTNRAHGELFATMSPVGDPLKATPRVNGIMLKECESLRDSAIYPDVQGYSGGTPNDEAGAAGRAPVTERDANGTPGAYFVFPDPEAINLWMNRKRAWTEGEWRSMAPQNEDVFRRLGKSIMNTHAEAFVTSAILYPTQPIAGYAA